MYETAKLTKSKSIPPSSDQIDKHKNTKKQRDTWQSDVDKLQAIVAGNNYARP